MLFYQNWVRYYTWNNPYCFTCVSEIDIPGQLAPIHGWTSSVKDEEERYRVYISMRTFVNPTESCLKPFVILKVFHIITALLKWNLRALDSLLGTCQY
jgi:hypothetical protein